MSNNNILFVSVEVPITLTKVELEREFPGLILTKIENSLVGEVSNNRFLFASSFGVLTFCNFSHQEIGSMLDRLGVPEAFSYSTALLNQDYPMIVDTQCEKPQIDSNVIRYNKFDKSVASIISLAISQSVGLEKREKSLEKKMYESRLIYDIIENLKMRDRKKLMKFSSSIAKERFDILNQLYLLDKPDIIWDDMELESLYNQLSNQLELKSRFDIIEYKINYLKESVELAIDLVNQKTSEYLEWIIIWLIAVEIFFTIYENFIKINL